MLFRRACVFLRQSPDTSSTIQCPVTPVSQDTEWYDEIFFNNSTLSYRCLLAALHFNENSEMGQAVKSDGLAQIFKAGEPVLKPVKAPCTHGNQLFVFYIHYGWMHTSHLYIYRIHQWSSEWGTHTPRRVPQLQSSQSSHQQLPSGYTRHFVIHFHEGWRTALNWWKSTWPWPGSMWKGSEFQLDWTKNDVTINVLQLILFNIEHL